MTLQGQTVLVTGATGFVGGKLALRLAADGVQVRALARSPQKGDFLRDKANIEIVPGDINDAPRMRAVTQGCIHVFHIAAALHGDLEHQRKANVEGVRNVMQAAAEAQVQRVLHLSSLAVYGLHHSDDVTEDMGTSPAKDAYSISKAKGEAVVRQIGAQRGLSYSIIRPGAIYGPGSDIWTADTFKLARRKPVVFIGSGQGVIPAIYVDDLLDLCIMAATHPAAHNEAFNASTDPAPTARQFIQAHSRLVGHQSWLGIPVGLAKLGAYGVAALARPHTIRKQAPEMVDYVNCYINFKNTKARDLLGWQPQVDLETGVQNSVPWLRELGLLNQAGPGQL